ncbi:bifunctional 5,10-methylenetetrahydrofolate dehydrogenase/5,10-methenyltetrahydrofolate cyclohydrolase [Streptomyces sp. NPDC059786]|uniref:bifunctional 5,10-methylenetetrahydrofolate dehydrogenase/5,10-methenyltetrahydrofolate cyclohydrolase n=1 Tax=Streptomyces sp. NPDC059786 TaxID=3346946 RepID=UPI003652BFFF
MTTTVTGKTATTLLLDGTAEARALRTKVAQDVAAAAQRYGAVPGLATVLVGNDPASVAYVTAKRRAIREAGMRDMHCYLPGNAAQAEVAAVIDELAQDSEVSGILLQLPLPEGLDAATLIDRIPVSKDVDGLTTASAGLLARGAHGLRPCTPVGVLHLLDGAHVELRGAHAVVVGHSALVGRPMARMLLQRDATVTVAHQHTVDLASLTRQADILIVAAGVHGLVGAEHVKQGAVVIDVGIHRTPEGLEGDVRAHELRGIARLITPVPGGVGPMTIAVLLTNTLLAFKQERTCS